MEKEYLRYIDDPKFIEWVFYPNDELVRYWKEFLKENPSQKQIIKRSVEVLKLIASNDRKLSPEEKHEILINALNNYSATKENSKGRKIAINFLRYAAIAIVFFSLGYLLYYQQNNIQQQLISEQISMPQTVEDAKIIFYDGEDISIKSKESVVDFSHDGKVVIDNDTIETAIGKEDEALNQIVIPYGKRSNLTLADGTSVWLNAGSRLLYPNNFNAKKREVFLIGEAYFDVTENRKKPFIVYTNELSVEVLGTEFNLSAYADENSVETVLTEGSVKLNRTSGSLFRKDIVLVPNQLAIFNKNTQGTKVKNVNVENYTSWKNGLFLFHSEDLNRVTKRLERYYNIKIQYSNPLSGSIKISGKLDLNNERETIIDNIATTASVKIQKINDSRYIIR